MTTDTNQASEDELEKILKKLYSHHLKLVAYLLDNRAPDPKFSEAVMLSEAKDAINVLIRTEKLKLLADVRERVIEDNYYQPDNPASDLVGHNRLVRDELRFEQRTALAKLEAEL